MEIVIFRHGQTDWNLAGRLQGSTDTELNTTGMAQAQALAERLLGFHFDVIVSSDLKRAFNTAQTVVSGRGIEVQIDRRLRELGLGQAEGKTYEEIESLYGSMTNIPERESAESLVARVNQVIEELWEKQHSRVAISSHGGVVWNWLVQYVDPDIIGRVENTDAFHLKKNAESITYFGRVDNSNK